MRSAPSVCSPVSLRSRLVYPSALLLIAPPPLRGRMDIDVLEGVTAEARPPAAVCLCACVFLSLPLSPARFPSRSFSTPPAPRDSPVALRKHKQ